MDFRENLTRLRLEKHMTQVDLAETVGVSLDVVVQWENGDSEPPIKDLIAISEAMQVSVDQLVGRIETISSDRKEPEEEEIVYCPCCGREVKGNLCLSCEFPMAGYQDKGPRYAIVLRNIVGDSSAYKQEAEHELSKFCGIIGEAAEPYLSRYAQLVGRRGLTDVAALWIAGRMNPEYFELKIVEDLGETEDELLEKPRIMEKPKYLYEDTSIGVGGIILIVVLTIIALSIF